MAAGLLTQFDDSFLDECPECEIESLCCDEACEGRIWVAPCGSIRYSDGEIPDLSVFCEPRGVTAMSHADNAPIREKKYRNCKMSRRRGEPDFQFTLGFDICQSDTAHGYLLGRCPFDYIIVPKARNLNFELNPSIFDQQTAVFWGRILGDSNTWEYPDDECQNTSRTYQMDTYYWENKIESLLAV